MSHQTAPGSTGAPRTNQGSAQNQGFLSFFLHACAKHAGVSWRDAVAPLLAAVGAYALVHLSLASVSALGAMCVGAVAAVVVGTLALRRALGTTARHDATVALVKALLDANRECLKLLDPNGRLLRISEYGAELMRAAGPDQLAGADWLDFWSGSEAIAARDAFEGALQGSRTSFTGTCPTTAGEPKVWQSRLIPVERSGGGIYGVLCASLDVTKEAELAADLRAKEALMSEMEAHIGLCFYSYSADFSYFHHISAGCASVFGLSASTLRERPEAWMDVVLPEDRPIVQAAMQRIAETSVGGRTQYRIRANGGAIRWVQSTAYPILDAAGKVARVIGVTEDVTAEQERLVELDRLAYTDSLTGLANRAALVRGIEERCRQDTSFALMFVDLDRFKVLNDTLGHTAADRLLKSLSEDIQASLPAGAFLARLGGDEFAVLIDDAQDKDHLAGIAKSILGALRQTGEPTPAGTFVTASIGISVFPENGADHETLLTSADIAMYAAKKAGRNGFRFADQVATGRIVDFRLERDVPAALAAKQFVLHYQPIYQPHSLEMCSVEALIRWRHPAHGLVPPDVFIPILEESGFINEVGAWVMDEALRQLAQWRQSGAQGLGVSVNVSARQLRDAAIVDVVNTALRRHGLPASSLQLELTESALMENPELAQRTLRALKELGVRIAIDDFGTGYSSLRYLADFSPDTLKIDRSFIARLESDFAIHKIVRGIIQLSHALGLTATAEGVEYPPQLRLLRDAQCDFVQGYLLSKPVAPEQVFGLSIVGSGAEGNVASVVTQDAGAVPHTA
ncbi:bifunctional diguanylate cyclase/phosphodiesterase [Caballeronia sp. M1242]|uniref:putative bifunctional diguanylate cyclase/phosphodiesterase n=1 Tax=Caballeronia sp. M1242 TaxID=2814653 RepID=UPI0019D15C33|nr:EAL domain-containing protein [Caballeronia sp. M1242]QSN63042.1 EAL domain-containing protein [Caballeronia sp. M1242]